MTIEARPVLSSEVEFVLLIIRALVSGDNRTLATFLAHTTLDWSYVRQLCIYHDLGPFVYPFLKNHSSLFPEASLEFFRNTYYCSVKHVALVEQEFSLIAAAFAKESIRVLPIKGMAFFYDLYQHYPVRPMTDIDLLVEEREFDRAEKVLIALGYEKELYGARERYWRNSQCHIAFSRKRSAITLIVELHWSLDFKRQKRTLIPELWERTKTITTGTMTLQLLSPEDSLFSLALHNRRYGRTLCLKNSYDAWLLLDRYAERFDWEYCLRQAREYRISSTLYFLLSQVRLLGRAMPRQVEEGLRLPASKKKRIQHFIENNTFLLKGHRYGKQLYLKLHFLLYESFWESFVYVITIPQEQFAKYYGLQPYRRGTYCLYWMRLFYIFYKTIRGCSAKRGGI